MIEKKTVRGYDNGVDDGYWFAMSRMRDSVFKQGKKAGQYEVAEKTRVLLDAALRAISSQESPDDVILIRLAIDFLLNFVTDIAPDEELMVPAMVRIKQSGVFLVPAFSDDCGTGWGTCVRANGDEKCWYFKQSVDLGGRLYAACTAAAERGCDHPAPRGEE